MKMIAWALCLLVLAGAAVASDGATFSVQEGNLYLQTPSELGSLFVNGKNIVEYLDKVDDLVTRFTMVSQENKDLKVYAVALTREDPVLIRVI
jgi:hypothetical protein